MLTVEALSMRFGGLLAIDAVSLSAAPQSITAIIGPNGAGKTTLFNCLTGFYKPTSGRILFNGHALHSLARADIAGIARVARTFQNIRLFGALTVLENLLIAQQRRRLGYARDMLGLAQAAQRGAVQRARDWLDFFGLSHEADTPAAALSYGAQRKVEMARALCSEPLLLCLDEPAAGLNAAESHDLMHLLARITREQGIGMLLIEHDMQVVMGISDRIVVLDYGRKLAEGTPQEIRRNPDVIRAYLGDAATAC